MTNYSLYLLGVQAVLLLATVQWAKAAKCSPRKEMEVIYHWKLLDFLWPSREARHEAIRHGEYEPRNVTPYDVNVYEDRYFVTTPRLRYGVPATLSTISDKRRDGQYLLKPFPDWKHNRLGNCDGLTSVYTTQIDEFGQLWVLDSGIVDVFESLTRVCQPKLVVYDLTDGDKLVGTYHVPDSVVDCNSALLSFQVDIRNGERNNLFVYIADTWGHHIIVFDFHHKKFYRVTHNSFLPNPHAVDFYVAGTRVFVIDGISSLAQQPICNNDRRVYYHATASFEECYVMASTLRDPAFVTNERAFPDSFYCYSKKRASQSSAEVMTGDGILLYTQITQNAIACSNTYIDYNLENSAIISRNDTTMQSITGIKFIGTELYALSTRDQLFLTGSLPEHEINFRILRAIANDLLCGTLCEKPCPKNKTPKSHSRF